MKVLVKRLGSLLMNGFLMNNVIMRINYKKTLTSTLFLLAFSLSHASESEQTSRFVLALGRFHPLILHLPIGALVFTFFLDVIGRLKKNYPKQSIKYALGFSSFFAIITCIVGYCLSLEGGYSENTLNIHLYTGILTAVLITLLYFLCNHTNRKISRIFFPLFVFTIISISVAGHYGSVLTHGDNFITEYIQAPEKEKTITSIDSLKIYDNVVLKVFEDKCIQCHNTTKRKGELSLASKVDLLEGGESGEVIVLGNSSESLLYKHSILPISDEKHMPPEGKPQLTKDELSLIKYWLDTGLRVNDKVANLPQNDTITKLLKSYLVFNKKAIEMASLKDIERVKNAGFSVRQLAPTKPELWVKYQGKDISKKALSSLKHIKEQVIELDLKNSKLTDDMLSGIKKLSNLEKLELSYTEITNNAFQYLSQLKELKTLNLVNTKITDEGLKKLLTSVTPERIYTWKTLVNPDITNALQKEFNVKINNGIPKGFIETARLKPPTLLTKKSLFTDTLTINLESKLKNTTVYYTLNGKEADSTSTVYTSPFVIDTTTNLSLKTYKKGWLSSEPLNASFFKINYQVTDYTIVHQPESNYSGPHKLFDMELGSENFKDDKWNGYLGNDINTTANLGSVKTVNHVTVSCLGRSRDWILFPTEIIVYTSVNKNSGFKKVGSLKLNENNRNDLSELKKFTVTFPEIKSQYFKIIVKNPKVLPKWHEGAGNPPWIFVDEILF